MADLVRDPEQAERLIAETFLPSRLDLGRASTPLAMQLPSRKVGTTTAGRLRYGRALKVFTGEPEDFHVNIALRGQVVARNARGDVGALGPGRAAAFGTGEPAQLLWPAEGEQLCLMLPRSTLESALERLLGEQLRRPLAVEFQLDLRTRPGRALSSAARLLLDDLADPATADRHPMADRHVEAVLVDRLLLAGHHNYTEQLERSMRVPSVRGVRRAVELLEERPAEPWTTVSLASHVHMSVRSLQQRFQDELGLPPMAYLREVRLRRVRESLEDSTADTTSVRGIATETGFLHQGRFAGLYRARFGESPSATLRRPPDA